MKYYYRLVLYILICILLVYDLVYEYFNTSLMLIIQVSSLLWMVMLIPQYLKGKNKNPMVTFSLLLAIVMLVSYFTSGSTGSTFLKTIVLCAIVPIPFIVGNIPEKEFRNVGIIMIILSLLTFVISTNRIRSIDELSYGGSYSALVTLPIGLYLLRKKSNTLKLVYSIAIFALVLFSAKRGDILACILAIVAYFILSPQKRKKGSFITGLISLIVIGLATLVLFNYFLESSEVFQYKYNQTMDGYTSGRDELYGSIWEYYINSPVDKIIIGYGFDGVPRIIGGRAHNDWLEIIFGEGIIGALVYALMLLSMARIVFDKKSDKAKRPLFLSILAIWLVKSIFSMYMFSMSTMVLFVLVGVLLNPQMKYD